MNYKSLDAEWDETWGEMHGITPKMGDQVLCCNLKVYAGEVVDILRGADQRFYVVRLRDGSVDEFAEEDVLMRKTGEAA